MIDINKISRIVLKKLLYLFLIFIFSCGQPKHNTEINDVTDSKTVNNDSLINEVFNYGKQYFAIKSTDSIIALYGSPKNKYKTEWCGGLCDDSLLTTYEYSNLSFNFFERDNSKIELERVCFFDKRISLPANLYIGKTTQKDIIRNLGLIDTDNNDAGRKITKSEDTSVYGTQLGAGDTVYFTYNINIDEYAIILLMTRDTLREISWVKNMN